MYYHLLKLSMFFLFFISFAAEESEVGTNRLTQEKSVSRFGITWTFDKAYPVGQFANGDWYVVGPVTITAISPKTQNDMHGSMVNPGIYKAQGFDVRIKHNKYDASANIETKLPFFIEKPSSILSSISIEKKASRDNPQMDTIAILTILSEIPKAGSFRPPYQGDNKAIIGNVDNLDLSFLAQVKRPLSAPDSLVEYAINYAKPIIELNSKWTGRYMHPASNMPGYGREIAKWSTRPVLLLNSDYSDEEKRALLINIVQMGIDIYGSAENGARWSADGGHNPGRKLPLIVAGMALNNQEILKYADTSKKQYFQEDQQTFFVSQKDVALTNSSQWAPDKRRKNVPYSESDIDMPEWGIRHYTRPQSDAKNWDAMYRGVNNSIIPGIALAARLMKAEEVWAHPAFFAYADRVMEKDRGQTDGGGTNSVPKYVLEMWDDFSN